MSADRIHETEVALKAVSGLLESTVLSPSTLRHVLELKARLEAELADLRDKAKGRCA